MSPAASRMPVPGAVAIDWHVGFECPFKRRFTLAQAAPVLLADGGPEAVLARCRGAAGGAEAASAPLSRTSPTASGLLETVVPAAEALRRAEAALKFRRSCRDCPANLDRGRRGFGCYGAVRLPVPGPSEEVLMAVIVRIMEGGDDVDATASAPIRHIWDNGLTGEAVAALRDRPGWFERRTAAVARVGPFLQKRDISSDQVLELFLARPRFPVAYSVLFGPFLGEAPRLAAGAGPAAVADLADLLRLFAAMALAADLGVPVHLTPLGPGEGAEDDGGPEARHASLPAMDLGLIDG